MSSECANLTYSHDTIPSDLGQGLSLVYDGSTVCGQLVKMKANVAGRTVHVSWGLDKQCSRAEEGEKLLDFRYLVWSGRGVRGERRGV